MMSGKVIRLGRIFRKTTGKAVIIALDHGRRHGPIKGIEKFRELVAKLVNADIDGVMATPSMIEKVADIVAGRVAVVARIDGTGTIKSPDETDDRLIASVERAIRVGADSVSVMLYPGSEREVQLWEKLARVVEEADYYGIPVLAEVIPRPPNLPNKLDPEAIAYGSRIASELGADIIKTLYPGNKESFRDIVDKVPVPILVLGGPKSESFTAFLSMVKDAVDSGAKGAVIGRNVFQQDDPVKAANALAMIVHKGASPEESLKSLS